MIKSSRVLVVDDEKQFVVSLSKVLRLRGFEVSMAFSGYEAVDAVKSQGCFDVVILDIKMPGMDGITTLEEIKQLSPNTQVIMLTGYASLESGAKAIRLGAYDYLMKPCDIEDLIEKIHEVQEAARIAHHPVLWKRKTVGALTLPHITKLYPEDPLVRALDMMSRQPGQETVEEAYIVDHEDRLRGIVTKRDLLNKAQQRHPDTALTWDRLLESTQFLPQQTVGEIMRTDPLTTSPEQSVTEAAQLMMKNNIRCLPVVSSGKVLGCVKLQDIFRYLVLK